MNLFKSPGPDGFKPLFFKTYWPFVRESVCNDVQHIFRTGHILRQMNHTFIALIPKLIGASRVDQFRPIALCNVTFKIVTKIIASRIRTVLSSIIAPTQSTFIPSRHITDNTIIDHELMFYMNSTKAKHGYMALKIDMAKAYDHVEWSLLKCLLLAHGFAPHLTDLILNCVSTPSYSLLLNGSAHGHFTASRGIRQGDPLSPALSTICFDLLSRILTKAENDGKIHGIKVSRTSPPISHLMYADDLNIYCKATASEAQEVAHCLRTFCDWSGHAFNYSKSSIHFSKNVPREEKLSILNILGMVECGHNSTYLGLPFCKHIHKTKEFGQIIDRVDQKLSGWKIRVLSYAGRSILVKAVAQTLPTYAMQTYKLSVSVCTKIDGLIRDFWWGFATDNVQTRHLYLKSWQSLCAPKLTGGLGFRRMQDVNEAFLTKLTWQMCTQRDKLWIQVLRSKYLHGLNLSDDS